MRGRSKVDPHSTVIERSGSWRGLAVSLFALCSEKPLGVSAECILSEASYRWLSNNAYPCTPGLGGHIRKPAPRPPSTQDAALGIDRGPRSGAASLSPVKAGIRPAAETALWPSCLLSMPLARGGRDLTDWGKGTTEASGEATGLSHVFWWKEGRFERTRDKISRSVRNSGG
jgi:hypothetical protein